MPYFVYAVGPFARLEQRACFEAFADASRHAKALRAGPTAPGVAIRVMFADDALAAEELLLQRREAPAQGPDD